jgi:hypothetical protein
LLYSAAIEATVVIEQPASTGNGGKTTIDSAAIETYVSACEADAERPIVVARCRNMLCRSPL